MNIEYTDHSHFIGPFDEKKLAEEVAKPEFLSAKVYQPGRIVEMSDREYRVGQAGNLIRVRP